MSAPRDRWFDREAGPIVRPYAVTKGRTAPAPGSYIGLIDVVTAVADPQLPADARLGREHRRLLSLCRQPVTVVDLASDIDLPVGVVRVLLSDLSQYGAVRVIASSAGQAANDRLLRNVLNGLQTL
ncbi:MAG TPA: DUF742 domain-containing protein [Lentzea sp.]